MKFRAVVDASGEQSCPARRRSSGAAGPSCAAGARRPDAPTYGLLTLNGSGPVALNTSVAIRAPCAETVIIMRSEGEDGAAGWRGALNLPETPPTCPAMIGEDLVACWWVAARAAVTRAYHAGGSRATVKGRRRQYYDDAASGGTVSSRRGARPPRLLTLSEQM